MFLRVPALVCGVVAAAVVLSASAGDACAQSRDGAKQGSGDAAIQVIEQRFLRRKLREAREWFDAGRYHDCVERCTALLNIEPDAAWRDEVRALRLSAKERLQAADVLQAEMTAETSWVEIGRPIRIRVRLTARAKDPVEWTLASGQAGANAVVDVRVREHGPGRIEGFTTFRVPITGLPAEAVLPQGDFIEGTAVIPTDNYAPLRPTPRTYQLVGAIRPTRLVAGARAAHRQVLVPQTQVEVWPAGAEQLSRDPEAAMVTALREEMPLRCLVAAFVTPAELRAAQAERLLDSLGGGFERGTMWPAICGALRRLTGEDLPDERDAWLAYWSRARHAAAEDAKAAEKDAKKPK
ncbi:MAG: hypothetical protein ACYTGX_08775 [Planctomycetota bacterium]|jgi:hypothetical protein